MCELCDLALADTEAENAPLSQLRYQVTGMDCAGCARKIETAVRRVPGVADVSISVTAATLAVHHAAAEAPGPGVETVVTGLGYGLRPIVAGQHQSALRADGDDDHSHGSRDGDWWMNPKVHLVLASGVALLVAAVLANILPVASPWFYLAALPIGLVPIARRAFAAARAGSPFSIEMLMTIAAVGAVIIGAGAEAASVVFLFLVGEVLEGVAAARARASIKGLAALVPKIALREQGDVLAEVGAAELAIADVIVVRPGDRIPADGLILSGDSNIDEASVTGESLPKPKGVGAAVFAGTINLDAVLRVRVTAAAADNTIARVIRLVEEAQEAKAPMERFIDRFSSVYTPGVIVVAALAAIVPTLLFGGAWGEWVYKGLAILLIGCPCALVISTPAAIAAALSAGARRGLLIKGGAVLEQIGRTTMVAFDKTGTLTEGAPMVTDVIGFNLAAGDVLRLAAALEAGSNHPLATAIMARAGDEAIVIPAGTALRSVAGSGVGGTVEGMDIFLGSPVAAYDLAPPDPPAAARITALQAEGKTVAVLLRAGRIVGVIALRDEPRADARAGLAALAARGIKTAMLTGDNPATAAAIGASLGIVVHAGLMPQDKLRLVRQMQAAGEIVVKVGDGINDAPALAAANVGVAMGGGTDVTLETADAAILHGRIGDVAGMIGLSRAAMRNIHQNIAVALGMKAFFLATTLLGLTGLWPAILADTGATVLVTMNALRLLAWAPQR